ncbi:hypothetical protein DPSP01_012724 [Paraphaeosphaeria sporulosa]
MPVDVATTCDGAGRLAGSSATIATAEFLPNDFLASQTSYGGSEQQTSFRRLPSPGRLYPDSDEVSDDDIPEQDQQSTRRVSAQTPVSVCGFELKDHGYRSASPRSPDLEQSPIALQIDPTDLEMNRVAQFVGYSESEFEEESDQDSHPLRPRSHRNGKLPRPNVSKNATDIRSNHNKSDARTNQPVAHVHNKRPVGLKAYKGTTNASKSKPAPFEQSSSSEDDQPPIGDDGEDGDTLHKSSLPQQQTPSQVRPQASPLVSRQTSSETPAKPPSQDASTKDTNAALRGRLQKALAKKGFPSSSPHNQDFGMAKNGTSNSGTLTSERRQEVDNSLRPLPDGARSASTTAQANRLAPNSGVQKTSPCAITQQHLQQQKAQHVARIQTQTAQVGTAQTGMAKRLHATASRHPAYGPFSASQQKPTGRQKQPESAPNPAKLIDSKAVDNHEVARDNAAKVPRPDVETPSAKKDFSGAGRNVSSPASSSSSRSPSRSTVAKPSAFLNQLSPSSVTSRPATSARASPANPKAPPKTASGRDAPQAELAKAQKAITTIYPANKPVQTKATSMMPSESKSIEATPRTQQHQMNVPGKVSVPKPPARRRTVSALQSLLTEVSTGASTVEKVTEERAQIGERIAVKNAMPRRNVRSGPTHGPTPARAKSGLDEIQSSSRDNHSDTAAHYAPVTSTTAARGNNGRTSQPSPGTGGGRSGTLGRTRASSNANADDRKKTTETRRASKGAPAGPVCPRRNSFEAPLQTSARQGSTPAKPPSTETPPTPFPAASETPSAVQATAPAAITRGPLKTHARVPSGPTEDGFDIYIPPAPGTSKAIPTPARADNVAATPAVPKAPAQEASQPAKKVAGADNIPSLRGSGQRSSSVATTASTHSTDVSTTAPLRKPKASTDQVGKAAAPIARDGHGEAAGATGAGTVQGGTSALDDLSAKKPGNVATATEPTVPLSTRNKTKSNLPNSGSPATVTPQHTTDRAGSGSELPELVLRDQPRAGPAPEPYFEYRIKQKMWAEPGTGQDGNALTIGFSSTVLETANRQAEELFTQTKDQYLYSFPVQHQQSSSAHDDDGCLALRGTLATTGWPVKQVHLKIWVERGEVPSDAATLNPPPKLTPFLSKTLYILRLYKLTEVPTVDSNEDKQEERHMVEDADGGDEGSGSEPGDDPSSADSDDDSSESESEADKGKHNKKRQAKQALRSSPPAKRRKTKSASPKRASPKALAKSAMSKRVVRQHQQMACPEVYTTLYAANSAACELQVEIMNEHTLLVEAARASNAGGLRRKLMGLVEKKGEERYWHNEFPFGLVGAKMEISVEPVTVCGPRNV